MLIKIKSIYESFLAKCICYIPSFQELEGCFWSTLYMVLQNEHSKNKFLITTGNIFLFHRVYSTELCTLENIQQMNSTGLLLHTYCFVILERWQKNEGGRGTFPRAKRYQPTYSLRTGEIHKGCFQARVCESISSSQSHFLSPIPVSPGHTVS